MLSSHRRSAFTLIELLIVIAIIAIVSVVVVLVLNPLNLLQQTRDSNRLSDLQTITKALSLVNTQGVSSFGTPGVIYLSIPDPTATSTAGTNCSGVGLSGNYHCAASSSYRNVNGTGWLPVNLTGLAINPPLSSLPVDPVNSTSTGECYAYEFNGTNWEIAALPESQKYSAQANTDFLAGTTRTLFSGDPCAAVTFVSSTLSFTGNLSGYVGFLQYVFDPHTNTVWASNEYGTTSTPGAYEIDAVTHVATPVGAYAYPQYNNNMAFDPNTNTMWLVDSNARTVTVINDTTLATTTIPVGNYPIGVAFDSHTNTMWVMNQISGTVTIISDGTFTTSTIAVKDAYGATFDPHTNAMWVTGDNITVVNDISFTTSTIAGSSAAGTDLAFDPHTNTMWGVTNTGVMVFDDSTYAVLKTIPLASSSFLPGLTFEPHTNSIWVATDGNDLSNELMQINDFSYATTSYKTATNNYNSIIYDSLTNSMWSTNGGDGVLLTPSR